MHNDSDSENDGDYVPPVVNESESSDDEPEVKRARTSSPKPTGDEEAEQKRAREALWASFQQSVSTPTPTNTAAPPKKMVKVEKRYLFAGENVVEVVEVSEDSPDAKKWPLWSSPDDPQSTVSPTPQSMQTKDSSESTSEPLSTPGASTSTPQPPPPKPAKRPGPRKGKVSLAPLPQKAKKISTLDKSAMDWQKHISTDGLTDELEANRRSGGYIEKVEFLQRVDERKEGSLEASKSNKRRRG